MGISAKVNFDSYLLFNMLFELNYNIISMEVICEMNPEEFRMWQ
jgi:hypothetical protein